MKQFVQDRRKAFVLDLIKDSALPGYRVGFELGFREEQSFYRWVKETFGMRWTELCRLHGDGATDGGGKRSSRG